MPGDENMKGKLNLSLYGTRDAAQNWASEYSGLLKKLGFVKGIASPCNFSQPERNLKLTVHGDDFLIAGSREDCLWLRKSMEQKYELNFDMLGWESDCKKEIRILNRVIRWTSDGIEYESDQRHADTIVKELGLDNCKTVSTPGTHEVKNEIEESQDGVLKGESATKSRSIAARLNFLALDRADLQYAAKCICKHMAVPV